MNEGTRLIDTQDTLTEIHFSIPPELQQKWDTFAETLTGGNLFQTWGYFEFYRKLPGYRPFVIFTVDGNEKIMGVLSAVIICAPNPLIRFFSRRIIVHGGPIFHPSIKDLHLVTRKILTMLRRVASGRAIYIEFRNLVSRQELAPVFEALGYSHEDHLNYIVRISGQDRFQKIHKTKIRQINKSLKSGATVGPPDTFEEVRSFYLILKELYRTKIKKPLPPLAFFTEFYKSGLGVYLLIKYNGEILGGMMCGLYKDTIYELYIAGLDRKYKNVYPSVLATYAAIEYALNNGLKYFDFLGAGKPKEEYGVREFKSRFGGELINPGRFILITKPFLFRIGKLALSFWKNHSR